MLILSRDDTPDLSRASVELQTFHPLTKTPTTEDLRFVQQVCKLVTTRAAALLATGIHALWTLYYTSNGLTPESVGSVSMGCNGSIIERYPNFRECCQKYLDELTMLSGGPKPPPRSVQLEVAYESAIFGAAVSVCCLKGLA